MAQVDIEEIINHLGFEVGRTLEQVVEHVAPEAEVDRDVLLREFKRWLRKKCTHWENVPDRCVRLDD